MNKSFFVTFAIFFMFASFVFGQKPVGGNRQLTQANESSVKRIALLIGNSAYETSPLPNPTNDATDMAAALRESGFLVVLKTNLNQNDMKRAIRDFGQKLRASGSIGLFYFAGHGVQVKGINYLIPVGVNVNTEQEIEYEGIDAGLVLAQMEAAQNKLNIVILDACRNNPFARSYRSADKGLAQMDAPSGTIIAYATAPGSVASDGKGKNGLYTQELLKNIRNNGLGIEDLFKRVRISVRAATSNQQTPWESSSLVGDFYFRGDSKSPQPPLDVADNNSGADELIWAAMKDSNDRNSFREFIKSFPKSRYVPVAQKRLQELTNQTTGNASLVLQNPRPSDANKVSINLITPYVLGNTKSPSASLVFGWVGLKGDDNVQVFLNSAEITSKITQQTQVLTLQGKPRELNLKVGLNELYVIVNGVKSEPSSFKVFE